MGEEIHIAEESAIIIWDAAAKTQHFIRRASFETRAKDFGFLVPTPTIPKLADADDEAFDQLARITAPPVFRHDPTVKSELPRPAPTAAAPAVVVVATAKLAGFEAAVLDASDASLLGLWLKQNGYASSPELVEWSKPYIAQKWMITAFKMDQDNPDIGRLSTSAVRMSFTAERPYFPYREPERTPATSAPARLLRIYFLGDARFAGTIGDGSPWPGKTVWANRLDPLDRDRVMKLLDLPPTTAPEAMHLTEFEDRASPRPGRDDLFFAASADQSLVEKSPQYPAHPGTPGWYYAVDAAIAAAFLALAFLVVRKVYRGSKES